MTESYDAFEFILGQYDCREGIPHKLGQSESYDAGYASEYQMSVIKSKDAERENAYS